MLKFDMSQNPIQSRCSSENLADHLHGLPVQGEVRHSHQSSDRQYGVENSIGFSEHLPLLMNQYPSPFHEMSMLEHKDTGIMDDDDISSAPIWMTELQCFCHILDQPGDSREREEQDQVHQKALHLHDPSVSFHGTDVNYAPNFEEHAAQTPVSMPTPGRYLRADSVLVPGGQKARSEHLLAYSSGRTTEITPIQGTKVRLSTQELSLLPSAHLHGRQHCQVSSASCGEIQKVYSDMNVVTTCRCSYMDTMQGEAVTETILPPLDAMNALMEAATEKSNEGMIHARKRQEILCGPRPVVAAPPFPKVESRLRVNSASVPSSPKPSDLASSMDVDTDNGRRVNPSRPETDIPPKKRAASRRSKFDPPYVYKYVNEKHKREQLAEKYNILKSLIPGSIKGDRASILEKTIAHVKNLGDQKANLEKIKHEKLKELCQQRAEKALCQEWEQSGEANCLWMKRTSRGGTQVDMRIVQNEISVSVIQKHLPRFLLRMVTALETKLKLEILNVTGHVIDDFDVYNFRVEIKGSSCTQASEIMANIMETLDSMF